MTQWPKGIARGTVGQPERAPYGRPNWLPVVPVARGVLQMHDLQQGGAPSRGFLERDTRSPFSKGSSQSHATWAAARCQDSQWPLAQVCPQAFPQGA